MPPDDPNARLKKIEDALERIERGLFGEQDLEHWGLIARVANHGKRIRRLEQWAAALVISAGTLGVLYRVAVDWFSR